MEKPLNMMLLTIAGFITAAVLLATVFPAVLRTGNAIAAERAGIGRQSSQSIVVVNGLSELDGSGTWQDGDADTYFDVWIWVKNNGAATIVDQEQLDVFVHRGGTSQRIPHVNDAAGAFPYWSAVVEGGGQWERGRTLEVTVHFASPFASGTTVLEVITAQGARSAGNFDL